MKRSASLIIGGLILGALPALGETNPYQRTYAGFGLARNYPVSFSEDKLQPGYASPLATYLYDLDEDWILGISAQFKILHHALPNKDKSDTLGLLNVSHETLYSIRLSHPMYLLTGLKLLYLLPTTNARLPIRRSDDFRSEVGLAATAALARVIDPNVLLIAYLDRWRGTATMKLHAIEAGVLIAFAIH
jgi:hypothetical protein